LLQLAGSNSSDFVDLYIFQQGQATGQDTAALAPGGSVRTAPNKGGVYDLTEGFAATGYRHDPAAGWQTLAGDVNGDGRTDIFCLTEYGHLWRVLAVGDGTFGPNENVAAPGFAIDSATGRAAFVADADGDGFDDLAHVAPDGLSLLANDAGTFAASAARIGDGLAYDPVSGYEILVGDFDGLAGEELLAFEPDGVATLIPLDGTSPRGAFGSIGVSSAVPPPGITCDGIQLLAGDFDGDGRTDVVAITESAILLALSTGTALAPPIVLPTSGFHFAPYRGKGWTVFAADTSGDGRDDLVQLNEWGYFWTARSTGAGFAQPFINAITGFEHRAEGPWQTFFGNFND